MLNTVTIRNMSNNQVKTYTIVSDTESDIRKGKMAIDVYKRQGYFTPIYTQVLGTTCLDLCLFNTDPSAGVLPYRYTYESPMVRPF